MANESDNVSEKNKEYDGRIERKMEPAVPFGIAMHQAGSYNVIDFLSMPGSKAEDKNRKAFASVIMDYDLAVMLLGASIDVLKNSKEMTEPLATMFLMASIDVLKNSNNGEVIESLNNIISKIESPNIDK